MVSHTYMLLQWCVSLSLTLLLVLPAHASVMVRFRLFNGTEVETSFVRRYASNREILAESHDFCYRLVRMNSNFYSVDLYNNKFLQACTRHLSVTLIDFNPHHLDCLNGCLYLTNQKVMESYPPSPYTARVLANSPYNATANTLNISDIYGDNFCEFIRSYPAGSILDKVKVSNHSMKSFAPFPRVLCAIITYSPRHASAMAVAETWGSRCNGFLAYSNSTDQSIPTVQVDFKTSESIINYWHKKVAVYKDIHENYAAFFDYIFLGDDDTYLIVPNLLEFLTSDDSIIALVTSGGGVYAGRPMRLDSFPNMPRYNQYFNSGAGYVLDRVALRAAVEAVKEGECGEGLKDNNADVYLAQCLKMFGIHPVDTTDRNGANKFHHYHPDLIASYNGELHSEVGNFYALNSYSFIPGVDGVSEQSLVFHYMKHPIYMRQVDAYFSVCGEESISV